MSRDNELDEDLAEIDRISEELDALSNHIDHLLSWHDFVSQCRVELEQLSARLSSVEAMVEICDTNNAIEADYGFGLGICWVGAVAAYEGHVHKLLINALAVDSLQSRITRFCEKKIFEKSPPKWNMKDATPETVREWLTTRTITDPRTMARNFDEIFGIKTQQPDDAFCQHLLEVRNAFTHRGGGNYQLVKDDVVGMIKSLNDFAISYTLNLVAEVETVLQEDV